MTLHTWLVFGHVLSAMVWVGGGLMLYMLGTRARRSAEPNAVAEFSRTLSQLGPRVLMPSVLGTLVFGVWMVLESPAWSFRQPWLMIGGTLFLLALLIGSIYLSRVGIGLQRAAERPEGRTEGTALLGRWITGYRIVVVVLLLAVWDMVFKPGL
jgi:uncharacterized membrane protein